MVREPSQLSQMILEVGGIGFSAAVCEADHVIASGILFQGEHGLSFALQTLFSCLASESLQSSVILLLVLIVKSVHSAAILAYYFQSCKTTRLLSVNMKTPVVSKWILFNFNTFLFSSVTLIFNLLLLLHPYTVFLHNTVRLDATKHMYSCFYGNAQRE